mmetsp:Transcript_8444/g.21587  ORF Transcript_8444/g.21587 Transcript_8444/m.21587 type:complete len:469 (-) Transcript_8444:74-1480(-)|eukprot:CAMPEP_0182924178 /NCGR_PEP_ID=MMETSP0105_2-20130417/5888_1 /TAXON_ID=81532 ORGANISM="Acanthoeca-like sp., Strain 10tr" /NCGR_SAMPLE_ID=MMETSP0105_2 /ASSEMBLY_ACC=CAM_ASM_000205 /LENGTH=468 /DNA_ID=CAMNT_0025061935 /DNA_START=238 /DNA_END=1644 /DNA_ORIENTATION=-
MADGGAGGDQLVLTAVLGVAVLLVALLLFRGRTAATAPPEKATGSAAAADGDALKAGRAQAPKTPTPKGGPSTKRPQHGKKAKAPASGHSWLVNMLKGHTGRITSVEMTPDDKAVVTAADDRTLRLWPVKGLTHRPPPSVVCNIELDYAKHLSFSPDGKACLAAMGQEHVLRLYRVDRKGKGNEGVLSHKRQVPAGPPFAFAVVGCGLSVANPVTRVGCTYLMAATADTELRYMTVDGDTLQTIDTKMMAQNHACLSADGRFTAVAGRLGRVRLVEVHGKGGSFVKAATVTDLSGLSGEAQHAAFSPCSRAVVGVGSGGSWAVWDVSVEFDRGADAREIGRGTFKHPGDGTMAVCAIAADLDIVAVGCGYRISLHSAVAGKLLETIDDAHIGGIITGVTFDAASNYVVSAGGMDKRICVWKNVAGKVRLRERLQRELARAAGNRAMEDHLQFQIAEATAFIDSVQAAA